MRNSTADRSPPIVMSSPCTVATTCSPFGATLPHTWARDPSRQHEVAECRCKLILHIFCGVTRAIQAVLRQSAHVFHLLGNPLSAVRRILSFAMERRNTPYVRRQVPQLFLHVSPWHILTARLSAPPAAASRRTLLVLRVSNILSRPTSCAHWASQVVPYQSPPNTS